MPLELPKEERLLNIQNIKNTSTYTQNYSNSYQRCQNIFVLKLQHIDIIK